MKLLKNIAISLLIAGIVFGVLYLSASFCYGTFDPIRFNKTVRFLIVFIPILVIIGSTDSIDSANQ